MIALHSPKQNHLLAALPVDDLKRLSPHLELVYMSLGESYHESGGELQYVYFPTSAIASLLFVMESGVPAEVAGVGNEGMLGISQVMGGDAMLSRAFVQTAGYAYKMRVPLLMEEFNRAGAMQRLLLRYIRALIAQTSQAALCNLHLSIDQRLCRWLLLILDRMRSDELMLAQEWVADIFGVGRTVVTGAVGKLLQAGLIRYHHGHIAVLKDYASERYRTGKMELDRLLGQDWDMQTMQETVLFPCQGKS